MQEGEGKEEGLVEERSGDTAAGQRFGWRRQKDAASMEEKRRETGRTRRERSVDMREEEDRS